VHSAAALAYSIKWGMCPSKEGISYFHVLSLSVVCLDYLRIGFEIWYVHTYLLPRIHLSTFPVPDENKTIESDYNLFRFLQLSLSLSLSLYSNFIAFLHSNDDIIDICLVVFYIS